jgi:hypothetical protein
VLSQPEDSTQEPQMDPVVHTSAPPTTHRRRGSEIAEPDSRPTSAPGLMDPHVQVGCDQFDRLDRGQWYTRTHMLCVAFDGHRLAPRLLGEVRRDMRVLYCTDNLRRVSPCKYQVSADALQCLAPLAEHLLSDWDTYLKTKHPGFSSFTNTVRLRNFILVIVVLPKGRGEPCTITGVDRSAPIRGKSSSSKRESSARPPFTGKNSSPGFL